MRKKLLKIILGVVIGSTLEVASYFTHNDYILLLFSLLLLIGGIWLCFTKYKFIGIGCLITLVLVVILLIVGFAYLTRLH